MISAMGGVTGGYPTPIVYPYCMLIIPLINSRLLTRDHSLSSHPGRGIRRSPLPPKLARINWRTAPPVARLGFRSSEETLPSSINAAIGGPTSFLPGRSKRWARRGGKKGKINSHVASCLPSTPLVPTERFNHVPRRWRRTYANFKGNREEEASRWPIHGIAPSSGLSVDRHRRPMPHDSGARA